MSTYLRSKNPGGTFFFTVVTFQRRKLFKDSKNRELLRNIIAKVREEHPFKLDAWVLLPHHLHCLWTLPPGDADYPKRWGLIKAKFTKAICGTEGMSSKLTGSRVRHREGTIWQRRFWEHQIRDDRDLQVHLNYLHFNPVKHGLVRSPWDWPHSSFRQFVSQGRYPANWGENMELKFDLDFGE
jgi:putative transposase